MLGASIACALRRGVVSVGFTLLGMAHPIRDNISGAGQESVEALIQGRTGVERRIVAFRITFCNCFVTFIFVVNECWYVIIC